MKALIIGPAWVGDMVMAHTLVQRLTPRYDDVQMLAPPATASVASRMAEVSTVHTVNFAHGELGLRKRRAAGRTLRQLAFDTAFVLPNSWKSALVPFFARIPRRAGWHGEARYGLLNDRRKLVAQDYPLMIERFMALAHDQGQLPTQPYPRPKLQLGDVRSVMQRLNLVGGDVIALCPGAEFGAAKKWPHFAQLAQQMLARDKQVWLLGSPNDVLDCQQIVDVASGAVNLAGKTSLLDAIDLLSQAEQVVCNDSGLMHIACAVDVPTIGVFGSTSPAFTPPLGDKAVVVERSLDCRPCFQRECPLGHLDCLNKLPVQAVIDRLVI